MENSDKNPPPVDYADIAQTFYGDQARSLNPLRSWFHVSRHRIVGQLVYRQYPKGGWVLDIGCGNCLWNTFGANVVGVDENRGLLEEAYEAKRIQKVIRGDILNTQLDSSSFDVAVATEVLEHLSNYPAVLLELFRVLKKGGHLVISVPYDTNLSLWKPLFKVQCLWRGTVLGEDYYKKECGHAHHFSPQSISKAVLDAGFQIVSITHNRFFTIFVDARK